MTFGYVTNALSNNNFVKKQGDINDASAKEENMHFQYRLEKFYKDLFGFSNNAEQFANSFGNLPIRVDPSAAATATPRVSQPIPARPIGIK
jgi:hypothetical protein